MFKKIFLLVVVLSSLFIGATCFAAPTETIAGAYIGMTKAELLSLQGYQNIYHYPNGPHRYESPPAENCIAFDDKTCIVYFDNKEKIIAIELDPANTYGGVTTYCSKKLDKSGLSCNAKMNDYINFEGVKAYPEELLDRTWIQLQDNTYLRFKGTFGAWLSAGDESITGLVLCKYKDSPYSEPQVIEEKSEEKETIKQPKKKKVPIEKKIADSARKILGF